MLTVKIVLTLLFTLVESVNVFILTAASAAAGFAWFAMFVYYCPSHSVRARSSSEAFGRPVAGALPSYDSACTPALHRHG